MAATVTVSCPFDGCDSPITADVSITVVGHASTYIDIDAELIKVSPESLKHLEIHMDDLDYKGS